MPPKTNYKRYKKKSKAMTSQKVTALVKKALNRTIETKQGVRQLGSDGTEIFHNNFVTMLNTPLQTIQGDGDQSASQGQRIGDKITLKGVSIRFMSELNERYSDVSLRFLFVKSAKGDTPTWYTLFNGVSGNKMLDTLNRERFHIIKDQWIKLKAGNAGTQGGFIATGSGVNEGSGDFTVSRATKITKVWIPGNKIAKGGELQYEDNSTQIKFHDYHCLLFAYSNYSAADSGPGAHYVARLNDCVVQMYYKDA